MVENRKSTAADNGVCPPHGNREHRRATKSRRQKLTDPTDVYLAQLEVVIGSMDEGIVVCNTTGRALQMNRGALEMYECASVEQAWRSLSDFGELFELHTPEGSPILPADWPLTRAVGGETFRELKVRIHNKRTASERIVSCAGAAIRDPQGNLKLAVLTGHELPEQTLSESRLRSVFRAAPIGIGLVLNRILLDVNERLCEMVGYRREELIGRSARMLYPTEESFDYVGREKYRQIHEHGTGTVEVPWRRKDGKLIRVLLSSTPLDPEDLSKGVTFTALDITARKKTEDELQSIFDLSPDLVCIADIRTGTFTKVNPAFERTVGYNEQELLSRPFVDFVHPDDVDDTVTVVRDRLRKGERVFHFESRFRCKDGSYRWLNWASQPRIEDGLAYAIARDVTERKEAEEMLRRQERRLQESERKLRTLMGNLPGVAYRCANTPDWPFEFVSEGSLALTGYEPAEITLGGTITYGSLIHPDDRQRVWDAVQDAVRRDVPFDLEYRIHTRDGQEKWVFERGRAVPSAQGDVPSLEGFIADVTERKGAEMALREKEYLLSESQRIGHIGTWSLDLADGAVTWTPETYRLYGVSPETFVPSAEAFLGLLHSDDRGAMQEWIRAALASEHPGILEFRAVLPDGSVRILSGRGEMVLADGNRPIRLVGTVQDVTEQKKTEEALRKLNESLELQVARRTEDLTHMVGRLQQLTLELSQAEDRERRRIADLLHDDVQQILAGARFHLNLLSTEPRSAEESQEVIRQVRQMLKDAIEKARSLSHELSPALYQVDLAEILNWLADHMQRRHGLTVHVKPHGQVDSSSEPLKALLYKMAQELLFNVVKHAGVKEARICVRRTGRHICLAVVDRGSGFDPLELDSTAGFGLLGIRERIQLLGGRMKIRSAPGMGSRFLIVVPDQGPSPTATRTQQGRSV